LLWAFAMCVVPNRHVAGGDAAIVELPAQIVDAVTQELRGRRLFGPHDQVHRAALHMDLDVNAAEFIGSERERDLGAAVRAGA